MGEPLGFVDPAKDPEHYVRRYVTEPDYKAWFHRNYPEHTIHEGIGISEEEFRDIAGRLEQQAVRDDAPDKTVKGDVQDNTARDAQDRTDGPAKPKELAEGLKETPQELPAAGEPRGEDLARTVFDSDEQASYDRRTFEEFVDERVLISRDLFGKKEMKIKILEVSDEHQESKIRWKFGDRVKVNKIIITIKHLDTMEVEEGEFDIEAIERELAEKRHYSSTNRWIPSGDIKNGYVVNSKHTALISDAVALDYIVF